MTDLPSPAAPQPEHVPDVGIPRSPAEFDASGASPVLNPAYAGAVSHPPPMDEDGGGVNIMRFVAAILRYKWLIVGITILGTLGGVGATKYLPPVYEVQGTFWIERPAGPTGPIRQAQLLDRSSWTELLRSFEVLETVARVNRLWIQPRDSVAPALFANLELTDSILTGKYEILYRASRGEVRLRRDDSRFTFEQTVPAGEPIGREVGLVWVPDPSLLPDGTPVRFSVSTPYQAAAYLRSEQLGARVDPDGSFLRVWLSDTSATRAARVLNSIMQRYVTLAADIKRDRLTEMTAILDDQLGTARRRMEAAETALEQFKVRTITLPSEQGVPVAPGLTQTTGTAVASYFQMKTEEDALRQDRFALEQVLRTAPDSGLRVDAIEIVPAAARSSGVTELLRALTAAQVNLRALRRRYTDENPQVIRAKEEVDELEQVAVPTQIRLLIDELRNREAQVAARIASAGRQLEEIPQRRIEEDRLSRTRSIAQTLYQDLEQRYQQARLAEASTVPDVRILDPAVPPDEPASNRAVMLILMGFAASLGFGVCLAIALDYLDRRVRYPEQVTKELGLPILGVVPRVGQSANGQELDPAVEAFRAIRLGLVHSIGTRGPVIVTVTSPGGGDGKSFTASNLALAFADAGHRTLLIDGDVRRGQLHRLFGISRKPGITDMLQGGATREEVIRRTSYPSLDCIGCGTRTHMAPELLGSPAMNEFLQAMRGIYGVIIVDSPPMSAGIDAFALGAFTQNLLLVIRTGTTNRELAGAKLEAMDRLPIRVLGAVLNDVRPGVDSYQYGYYTSYLPGYTTGDERFEEPVKTTGTLVNEGSPNE